MLTGQGHIDKGEILAQLLKHWRHCVLIVIPSQAKVLMTPHGSHFVWWESALSCAFRLLWLTDWLSLARSAALSLSLLTSTVLLLSLSLSVRRCVHFRCFFCSISTRATTTTTLALTLALSRPAAAAAATLQRNWNAVSWEWNNNCACARTALQLHLFSFLMHNKNALINFSTHTHTHIDRKRESERVNWSNDPDTDPTRPPIVVATNLWQPRWQPLHQMQHKLRLRRCKAVASLHRIQRTWPRQPTACWGKEM